MVLTPEQLYLNLLKKTLLNWQYGEHEVNEYSIIKPFNRFISCIPIEKIRHLKVVKSTPMNVHDRTVGGGWPSIAHTMIGMKRLDNIQDCIENILRDSVEGDLIETGVWRGGAVIFMRGCLKAYGDTTRQVWVADSFEGLPKPNGEKYPADKDDLHYQHGDVLAISLEEVRDNFRKYDLLDDRVHFLKGWFKDTLPSAPIEKLSLLRLDGDLYESTMDALINLYPILSIGGYCIVDDYGAISGCRQAITNYRKENGITDPIHEIDQTGIYWKKGELL